MGEVKLKKPTMAYADDIMDFRQELLDEGADFAGCGALQDCTSAEEWIRFVEQNENNAQEGSVTSNSYIAVRVCDDKIVGIIDFRHHIDHRILSVWGGHSGYTVRPSERRKGYAKDMLGQNLQHCRTRGLRRVLLVCDSDNIGSEKTILANGGIFEKEICIDGMTMKRYWVEL